MEKAWKLISFNPWSFYLCAFIKHLSASGRGGSQGDSYTLMPSIATLLRSRTFCLIYKSWQMQPLIGLVSVDSQSATHFFDASVQFSSVTQSFPTLCGPMECSTPGFPVHHQLLELAQTHVHGVSYAIQPSPSNAITIWCLQFFNLFLPVMPTGLTSICPNLNPSLRCNLPFISLYL